MDTIEDIMKFVNKKQKSCPTVIKLKNFLAKNDLLLNQVIKEWTNHPATIRNTFKGKYVILHPQGYNNSFRNLYIRCNKSCNECKHNIKCALENITGGSK